MKKINFTKMVAAGNDFVIVRSLNYSTAGLKNLAREVCDRKYGIGADGFLVTEKSRIADLSMRIFNADGSEAQMCGNGARCVALYINRQLSSARRKLKIETKAGIIQAKVVGDNVKIELTEPGGIKLDLTIKVNKRTLKVNFINTGVPHCVVFVEGLDKIDVFSLGRQLRYHRKFAPEGTNADFVEVLNNNFIKIRTYERGVEDETLACGTGSVASALVYSRKFLSDGHHKIDVLTKSGDVLGVYFEKSEGRFKEIWLEGDARIVYKGAYYV